MIANSLSDTCTGTLQLLPTWKLSNASTAVQEALSCPPLFRRPGTFPFPVMFFTDFLFPGQVEGTPIIHTRLNESANRALRVCQKVIEMKKNDMESVHTTIAE